MNIVNMHEAKTQLWKLVDKAANGEPFIIARAGKPLVKVVALDSPILKSPSRFDFMKGPIEIPDGFDTMMSKEIEEMSYGENEAAARHASHSGSGWDSRRLSKNSPQFNWRR